MLNTGYVMMNPAFMATIFITAAYAAYLAQERQFIDQRIPTSCSKIKEQGLLEC